MKLECCFPRRVKGVLNTLAITEGWSPGSAKSQRLRSSRSRLGAESTTSDPLLDAYTAPVFYAGNLVGLCSVLLHVALGVVKGFQFSANWFRSYINLLKNNSFAIPYLYINMPLIKAYLFILCV